MPSLSFRLQSFAQLGAEQVSKPNSIKVALNVGSFNGALMFNMFLLVERLSHTHSYRVTGSELERAYILINGYLDKSVE